MGWVISLVWNWNLECGIVTGNEDGDESGIGDAGVRMGITTCIFTSIYMKIMMGN